MAAPQTPAGVSGKPGRSIGAGGADRGAEPERGEVRDVQRAGAAVVGAAFGAGDGDMAEGVGALVAEGGGVGGAAAADRVEDEEEGARHQAIRWWTSGPSSGGASCSR